MSRKRTNLQSSEKGFSFSPSAGLSSLPDGVTALRVPCSPEFKMPIMYCAFSASGLVHLMNSRLSIGWIHCCFSDFYSELHCAPNNWLLRHHEFD